MPGGDDHLVEAPEHLGGEQAQVVFERQHAPVRLIGPVAVPEHHLGEDGEDRLAQFGGRSSGVV